MFRALLDQAENVASHSDTTELTATVNAKNSRMLGILEHYGFIGHPDGEGYYDFSRAVSR